MSPVGVLNFFFMFLLFEITEIGGASVLVGLFLLPLIAEVLLSK